MLLGRLLWGQVQRDEQSSMGIGDSAVTLQLVRQLALHHQHAEAPMFRLDHVPGAVVLACADHDEVLPDACEWQEALARGRVSDEGTTTLVAAAAAVDFDSGTATSRAAGSAASRCGRRVRGVDLAIWLASKGSE